MKPSTFTNTVFARSTNPRDIMGTPEWNARFAADVAEYDSYVPKIAGNGRTGSTRVKNAKKVPSSMPTRKRAA